MINARDIYNFASTAQAAYGQLQFDKIILEERLAKGIDTEPLLSKTQAQEFAAEWHMKNLIKTSSSRG